MTAVMLAITAPVSARPLTEPAAVQQFRRLVAGYVALHKRVEEPLPPLRVSDDARDIYEAVDAMANAMRAARSDAKVGDIFTPEVAEEFRRRLGEEVRARGYDPIELITEIGEDAAEDTACQDATLLVNQPWRCGFAMTPPFVLEVLPTLPAELQYRFAGRDMVLLDTHAELVVDILRGALPVN
jgi:hypothetical protein